MHNNILRFCYVEFGVHFFINVSKDHKLVSVCQVDWDGYTIGYYGRIFEARNKTKGGSFEVSTRFFASCWFH